MAASPDTVSPARSVALDHLERVRRDDAYADALTVDDADARTRRQAKELVAGVTRQRRWLDFILSEAYHGDLNSMEYPLRQILRLGLYELLFQSTATHAAVHEYVELAKTELRPGAGNLVNGVLRTIDRAGDDLPTPDSGSVAEGLAIRHSHPTWLVERWLERFGPEETEELLRWNNRRPSYSLRVDSNSSPDELERWLDAHDVVYRRSPYLDGVLRVQRLQPLVQEGLLEDGRVAVQDESAGLVVRLLDPKPGETILDGCAAPGGKTIHAAALMQGSGAIHAVDVNDARLRRVDEAAAAHGVASIVHTEASELQELARRPDPLQADRVLLDVPCTGLGVLSKRADLRWQRSPADLDEMAALQDELLDAAARLVRPGGLLVYSTCTLEPEENEDRIDAFLDRHTGFQIESAADVVPDEMVAPDGFLTTLPHRHRTDGAFAARLRHGPAPNADR